MGRPRKGVSGVDLRKATFYRVCIAESRIIDCCNLSNGKLEGDYGDVSRQKLMVEGWTVEIFLERRLLKVCYRASPLTRPRLSKTLPLCDGELFLVCDVLNSVNLFFNETDPVAVIQNKFGISEIVFEDPNSTRRGPWEHNQTGSGVPQLEEQRLFWAMSDDVGAMPQTADEVTVSHPSDDELQFYRGELNYTPTLASWVVTCEVTWGTNGLARKTTLYLKGADSLQAAASSMDDYLSRQDYSRFEDCFEGLCYLGDVRYDLVSAD